MATPPTAPPERAPEAMFRRGLGAITRAIRRAPRQMAFAVVGTTLFAMMTVLSSLVIGRITDEVILPAVDRGEVTTAALIGSGAAIVGIGAARGLGITMRRIGAYAATYHLQARDRRELTDKYLELPIEWHRRHPPGQLLSNVNADVEAAAYVTTPLPMAIGVSVMVVITLGVLLFTDVFLAAVTLLLAPALIAANIQYQRRSYVATSAAQRNRSEVADIAHESFDAALIVKTLGREDAEADRFRQRSDLLRDHMIEVGKIRSMFNPLMEALPTLGILAILAVGVWRVDQGAMTTGTLVTFAYLFRLMSLPLRVFGWLLGELPRSTVGIARIERVLGDTSRFVYGSRALAGRGGAGAEVDSVAYVYPETEEVDLSESDAPAAAAGDEDDRRGVESITLEVSPRTTVAVVGPTGSGKSTVAQLLVRLFDPQSGRIQLDDTHIVEIGRDALSSSTALVFQEAFLFNATVAENISLGRAVSQSDVEWAARIAQAHSFIEQLDSGYDTVVGERGASLSGGQRQRIALARALVGRPRLLVLDDATSAVDPSVEAHILEALSEIDTSVVIVAHRRSSILLADEVAFVSEGRVTDRGTHDDLYARLPAYRALIDAYEDAA